MLVNVHHLDSSLICALILSSGSAVDCGSHLGSKLELKHCLPLWLTACVTNVSHFSSL